MKQHKTIHRFYFRCALLALPFLLLGVLYVVEDPFMVLRRYADYDHPKVCQSEGTVSWLKYKAYRDSMHYDSFIMGSSCTKAFSTADWNQYIHGRPFRMFCNNEGVADLCQKLEALDRQPHQPIRHLLIVCEDRFFVNADVQNDVMHVMPPEVSGLGGPAYQAIFMQGFFSPMFLGKYLKYQLTGHYEPSMNGVINPFGQTHTRYTNDAVLPDERKIARMGEDFWQSDHWRMERRRHGVRTESPRTIYSGQLATLQRIRHICRKHRTDVRLVIGPMYNGPAMNREDVRILRSLFGEKKVLDASDSAHAYLSDYHNFYDGAHYRVGIGKKLLRELYCI